MSKKFWKIIFGFKRGPQCSNGGIGDKKRHSYIMMSARRILGSNNIAGVPYVPK